MFGLVDVFLVVYVLWGRGGEEELRAREEMWIEISIVVQSGSLFPPLPVTQFCVDKMLKRIVDWRLLIVRCLQYGIAITAENEFICNDIFDQYPNTGKALTKENIVFGEETLRKLGWVTNLTWSLSRLEVSLMFSHFFFSLRYAFK